MLCPEMKFLMKQKLNLIINDKHQLTTKDGKLILSHKLANKVALFCHKNHESYSHILQRMNKRFIAYKVPSLVQNIIRLCPICQITYQKRSKIHNWVECTKPLQRGHLDIGHCSLYKSDFFVLKDSFSNFLFANWIPKQDASTICNKLRRIFELTAGNHIKQFLSSFGTKHTFSIVKQHNTNGAAERAIRSIKDHLYKEKTLGNGEEMAMRNTLTRLRCNPYKDGTPYTKFYNDPERLPNKL
uniref:Integrase_H2C2 domain-containing protein n=1 Tax=Strongyloides venezuelensis TaxID=75913 RepID=A0A0K0FRW9_STRVS